MLILSPLPTLKNLPFLYPELDPMFREYPQNLDYPPQHRHYFTLPCDFADEYTPPHFILLHPTSVCTIPTHPCFLISIIPLTPFSSPQNRLGAWYLPYNITYPLQLGIDIVFRTGSMSTPTWELKAVHQFSSPLRLLSYKSGGG